MRILTNHILFTIVYKLNELVLLYIGVDIDVYLFNQIKVCMSFYVIVTLLNGESSSWIELIDKYNVALK